MTTFAARAAAGRATVPAPSAAVRVTSHVLVAWCLGFAAVNGWHLVSGGPSGTVLSEHVVGVTVVSVLVLLLKLVGAGMAVAAVRATPRARASWLLAVGLWGAAGLLVLYSLGNVLITVGTVSGLLEPTPAWEAAGGVTGRAVSYLLFFLVAAPMFTAVAASYQRRLRPHRSAVAAGVVGAPVLLGVLLVALPAVLSASGLLP